MSLELKALESALREPFSPELVHFTPTKTRQNPKTKRWEYLALPFADKQVYEDRLNLLAFGEWSTPATAPLVAGTTLIIPVTVVLLGVAHTDVGEACLREGENSAMHAYSQGFRQACSHFGLGRYLSQLGTLWLPYDPETQQPFPMNAGERLAWVEKLYMDAGLSPRKHAHPTPLPPEEKAPSKTPATLSSATTTATDPQQPAPADRVDAAQLKYLRSALGDEQRKKSCLYYRVADLSELTVAQATHLADFIDTQHKKKATTRAQP